MLDHIPVKRILAVAVLDEPVSRIAAGVREVGSCFSNGIVKRSLLPGCDLPELFPTEAHQSICR